MIWLTLTKPTAQAAVRACRKLALFDDALHACPARRLLRDWRGDNGASASLAKLVRWLSFPDAEKLIPFSAEGADCLRLIAQSFPEIEGLQPLARMLGTGISEPAAVTTEDVWP